MPAGFSRLIKEDKERLGSENKLAAETGVNRNTIHYWLANRDAVPSFECLLTYTKNIACSLSRKKQYFEECLLPVPLEYQQTAEGMTEVPIIGTVHAGHTAWGEQEALGTLPVAEKQLRDADVHFYLIVEGDCMNKLIPEGSLALVSEGRHPINGNTVVVAKDDEEHMIRRYYKHGTKIWLEPESFNPEHKALGIEEEEFYRSGWRIIGVVKSAVIDL